jgi:hypothetical protein
MTAETIFVNLEETPQEATEGASNASGEPEPDGGYPKGLPRA